MNRSGNDDGRDNLGLWRQAVARAIHGKRGQAFMREMEAALAALPAKRLITGNLVSYGDCCALGAVALARELDVDGLAEYDLDRDIMADTFGIAPAMVAEIMFENDEAGSYLGETPERRYDRVLAWVRSEMEGGEHE